MTDDQRQRIHDIEYSCEGRTELAERIVALEDACAQKAKSSDDYMMQLISCETSLNGMHLIYDIVSERYDEVIDLLRDARDEYVGLRETLDFALDSKRIAERMVTIRSDENAKLREQLERVQPTDCEGNVLDIADTVHMLRSEYDGDHEWEDVVTELVLTKWGGDRWIVRGSKGEAWACDCTKTGYDEDAYEASDDVEPFGEPTLLEVEDAKLRELCADMLMCLTWQCEPHGYMADGCDHCRFSGKTHGMCGLGMFRGRSRELGVEVDG